MKVKVFKNEMGNLEVADEQGVNITTIGIGELYDYINLLQTTNELTEVVFVNDKGEDAFTLIKK